MLLSQIRKDPDKGYCTFVVSMSGFKVDHTLDIDWIMDIGAI